MYCQKCGKISNEQSCTCPFCGEFYSLGAVLKWIAESKGEKSFCDTRALKACISDLCKDSKYDSIVLEGLLSRGFSKRVVDLYNNSDFLDSLLSYCETLQDTYNIEKILYIADSFYFALTSSHIPDDSKAKLINNSPSKPQPNQPNSPANTPTPTIIDKVQNFDLNKFLSNISFQTIISSIKKFVNKNKKLSIGIVAFVVLLIAINIISGIPKKSKTTKDNNSTSYESSQESEYDNNDDIDDIDDVPSDLLTENSVSDTVYQGSVKEYKIKADNSGVYRFTANDRTANYNVFINVYNANDDRVLSETNEGSCSLDAGGIYRITVETDSPSCSYNLVINRPNPVKTLSSEVFSVDDKITFIDQQNCYSFSAPVTGRYRVDCLDRSDGINVNVEIYNSNNERVFRETNGGYLDMQKGVVYSIYVSYSTGFCSYKVNVSIPSDVFEISEEAKTVEGAISFSNQINIYSYSAPKNGRYRFECADRTNGYNVQLRIYDSNNERILRETNNGTVELSQGVKYRIEVEYESELCSYKMNIGVPNDVKKLESGKAISDSISFVDQQNKYTFTPSSSGEYILSTTGRTNNYNVTLYMYDANGERILRNDNEGTVNLTANTLYSIEVCYNDNLCKYNLTIKKG